MSECLNQRDQISKDLLKSLKDTIKDETGSKPWGIEIKGLQINDIRLPQELVRAMSKQAEAEREREARVTKSKGELESAEYFKKAAAIYRNNPEGLKLRELQTYQEIGSEKNTLMMVIPQGMANESSSLLPFEAIQELSQRVANLESRKRGKKDGKQQE